MPHYTIEDLDGSKRTISWDGQKDPRWMQKREDFCANVAHGIPPTEAYLDAYHRDDTASINLKSVAVKAAALLQDTDIVLRIHRLKQKVVRKVTQKWEYTLTKALEQCDEAYRLAYTQGNVSGMTKAIELQAKLTKLLAEQIDVNHRHGLLDDASTEVLLEMKKQLEDRRKRLARNTVTVESIAPAGTDGSSTGERPATTGETGVRTSAVPPT